MPTMDHFKIFLVFVLVHHLSWPCLTQQVREKIICPRYGYVNCRTSGATNPSIRVVDVIYGRVVGLNECGFTPTVNCTAPAYCEVAEKSNRRSAGDWLYPNSLKSDPCPGENKYLIIKYKCLDWKDTPLFGENFALKKPTFQSQIRSEGKPSKAVDGNTRNRDYTACTHTAKETRPWWRVDLEQRIVVFHVRIFNRNSNALRLCGFQIRIGDSIKNTGTTNARCGTLRHIPTNKDDVISCEPPLVGRYVTIVIPGKDKILTLCEVEVYGTGVLGQRNLTGVHLIGSNLLYEGHVVLDGSTFCDPMWSPRDQNTTCMQLGYPRTSTGIPSGSFFGQSESDVSPVVKKINCSSAESSLNECAQTDASGETCLSKNTVKVRCQPFLRLGGSNIPLEGRVEVLHEGAWGTVCVYSSSTNWKGEGARVTCRELGFYDAVGYFRSQETFKMASGTIWLKDVNCKGDERSLVFCKHNNWENTVCGHYYDIAVRCSICAEPLLKDETRFPNTIFNASAWRSSDYSPSSGRLYSPSPWCLPDTHLDQNQFLEINLPAIYSLSAVATVGGSLGYVTSYELSYMVSGNQWLYATVNNKQIISGNTNNDTHNVIRRELDEPCHVQHVRFIPKTWIDIPCMRVELCGKEFPRCHPSTITIIGITSTSASVTWEPLRIPDTGKQHNNYSVTLSRAESYDTKTTEHTSLFIAHLLPYRQYNVSVIAVGLQECYSMHVPPTSFLTAEAVPSGSPVNAQVKEVKDIDSKTLSVTWSPPDIEKRNGKITNYSVCYSTATLTADCNNGSIVNTTATSITIKGLETTTIYFFRIRAYTKVGPGPYTKEINITTSSGPVEVAKNINITSSSYGVHLQQPRKGFNYIQIIVVKLKDRKAPSNFPNSYGKARISVVNESVGVSQPYVTAELSASQVKQNNDFVIGDGKNYRRLSSRRRRDAEELTTLFYNRPLEQNSFYSAFQRTFKDEDTYYSSSWAEPIQTAIKMNPPSTEKMTGNESVAWIGIVVGGVVLVILVVLLVVYIKRRQARLSKKNSAKPLVELDLKETHVTRNAAFCENTEYANINELAEDSGTKVNDHSEDSGTKVNDHSEDGDTKVNDHEDGDTDSETDAAGDNPEPENVYGNAKVTETRDPFRMVPVDEFQSYVRDMKTNKNFGFEQQFKELPQGVCYSCIIAKSAENMPHNRYRNIVSYDDALVTLSEDDGQTYINGSFIAGVEPKSYIATQGPTPKTICTFWKMVWEQESTVIVMLTNLKEKEKVKCSKYWPDKSQEYGNITVTMQNKQLFSYYVIRTFLLVKGENQRLVFQFHFTAWPDHGVPKYPTQLLAFQNCIRLMSNRMTGPMIVHCSAGVGRTGTFICIHHVIECLSLEQKNSVDVFEIVREMRKSRVDMIQTMGQYILVHEAILEYILCGVNEIEGSYLEGTVENLLKRNSATKQTGFEELFQRLKNLSPVLTKEECKTATLKRNASKNRTLDIYPADYARVTLSHKLTKKGSDYINATFVDGYKQKNAYIATESPLTNTFADFWEMIYEQKSPLVVMLNGFKEDSLIYPEYFPTEKTKAIHYGTLFVRLDNCVEDQAFVFRKFSISSTSDFKSSSSVRHFQYTQWHKGGVPTKTDDILQMIQAIQTAQRQNSQGPMVVHCGNGAGRTGTFLTLSICLERLKAEHRVDVFQCIKLIREKRPQFVETTAQLQFCYQVLAKYIDSFEGYSNFE